MKWKKELEDFKDGLYNTVLYDSKTCQVFDKYSLRRKRKEMQRKERSQQVLYSDLAEVVSPEEAEEKFVIKVDESEGIELKLVWKEKHDYEIFIRPSSAVMEHEKLSDADDIGFEWKVLYFAEKLAQRRTNCKGNIMHICSLFLSLIS